MSMGIWTRCTMSIALKNLLRLVFDDANNPPTTSRPFISLKNVQIYGLGDYYALVNILSYLCDRHTWYKLRRNFVGLDRSAQLWYEKIRLARMSFVY